MMEDLITDLRNMTHLGRFARAEVHEILMYLDSVGWLSEPKALPTPAPPDMPPPPSAVNDAARNYMAENIAPVVLDSYTVHE